MTDRVDVAPGVVRTDWFWGYCLEGTKEDLLRAGFAKDEWFPSGERDKRGRVVRTKKLEVDGRLIECRQEGKERFRVYVHHSERERELAEARNELTRARDREHKELAALPASHDDYRQQYGAFAARAIESLVEGLCADGVGGYHYAPEVIDELRAKVGEIENILEIGRTLFDPNEKASRVAAIKVKTAEADPTFYSFMESLTKK